MTRSGGLALTFRQPAAHTSRPAREANHASTEAEGRVRSENRTLIVRRLVVVVILFSKHRLVLAALARPILVRPILTWLCLTRIYLTGISLVRSTLTRVSLTGVALIGIILSTLARIALTTSQIVTHHVTFRFKHDAECAESKDQLAQQGFVPVAGNAEACGRSCHLYKTEQSWDVQPAKFLDHRHFWHPGAVTERA